jgi:hypothetical protein
MMVTVDLAGETAAVGLADPRVFDDLRVVVEADGEPSTEALAAALAGAGFLDADGRHVRLAADSLPRLAGGLADDPTWRSEYDRMVAYASGQGWVDDDGRIRAHLEYR